MTSVVLKRKVDNTYKVASIRGQGFSQAGLYRHLRGVNDDPRSRCSTTAYTVPMRGTGYPVRPNGPWQEQVARLEAQPAIFEQVATLPQTAHLPHRGAPGVVARGKLGLSTLMDRERPAARKVDMYVRMVRMHSRPSNNHQDINVIPWTGYPAECTNCLFNT